MQNCYKVAWGAASWYNDEVKLTWFWPSDASYILSRDNRKVISAMDTSIPQNLTQCAFDFGTPSIQSIPQKQCKDCKQIFPATRDFFYPNNSNKDGWGTQCISCRSEYMRKRHALKHPDAIPRTGERVPPPEQKICSKCGQSKPGNTESFRPHVSTKDGLYGYCRECLYKIETERLHKRHESNPPVFSEEALKKCSACGQEFPSTSEYFHLNKRKPDGLDIECRPCRSKRAKQRRLENPDKDQWQKFMYRDANRESLREKGRAYAIAHRAEHNASHRKRMATLEQNGGTLTARDIQNQHDQQKGKCYWCHKKLEKYHVDHVVPIIRGGSNDPSNIVIACPFCNISKGSKTVEEWLAYLEKFILSKDPDKWIDSDDIVS